MADRRSQHYVPRLHLRRWAQGKRIRQHRRSGDVRDIGISDAAASRHFNAFIDLEGNRSKELEAFLDREVEYRASRSLQNLWSGTWPLSEIDRQNIARLLAFQVARGPAARFIIDQLDTTLMPLIAATEVAKLRRQRGEPANAADVRAIHETILRHGLPQALQRSTTTNAYIRQLLRSADHLQGQLLDAQWTLLKAETSVFITSDNPAVVAHPQLPPGAFGGMTLAESGELRFAASPRLALLIASTALGPPVLEADDEAIRTTNALTARSCHDCVFYHPAQHSMPDLRLAPEPPALPTPSITWSQAPSLKDATGPSLSEEPRFPAVLDDSIEQLLRQIHPDR